MEMSNSPMTPGLSTSSVVNAIVGAVTIIGTAVCALDRISKEVSASKSRNDDESAGRAGQKA